MDIYSPYYLLFNDNNNLNERWDTRTHPFYGLVLNGNGFTIEQISLKSNKNIIVNGQKINEGKPVTYIIFLIQLTKSEITQE